MWTHLSFTLSSGSVSSVSETNQRAVLLSTVGPNASPLRFQRLDLWEKMFETSLVPAASLRTSTTTRAFGADRSIDFVVVQICHSGECPPCDRTSVQTCLCGKSKATRNCNDLNFQCDKICGRMFDCQIHRCQKICHRGECGPCPRQGARTCPCGKTSSFSRFFVRDKAKRFVVL